MNIFFLLLILAGIVSAIFLSIALWLAKSSNQIITITDDATKKTTELWAELAQKCNVSKGYSDEELDRICPIPSTPTTRKFWDFAKQDPNSLGMSYVDMAQGDLSKYMTLREYILMLLQTRKTYATKELSCLFPVLDTYGYAVGTRLGSGHICLSNIYHDQGFSFRGPRSEVV